MSRPALLDVNVLVALFNPDHIHHDTAHDWFAENHTDGWATCPITEQGVVRILANPKYWSEFERTAALVERARDVLLERASSLLVRRHLAAGCDALQSLAHLRSPSAHGRLSARPGKENGRPAGDVRSDDSAQGGDRGEQGHGRGHCAGGLTRLGIRCSVHATR